MPPKMNWARVARERRMWRWLKSQSISRIELDGYLREVEPASILNPVSPIVYVPLDSNCIEFQEHLIKKYELSRPSASIATALLEGQFDTSGNVHDMRVPEERREAVARLVGIRWDIGSGWDLLDEEQDELLTILSRWHPRLINYAWRKCRSVQELNLMACEINRVLAAEDCDIHVRTYEQEIREVLHDIGVEHGLEGLVGSLVATILVLRNFARPYSPVTWRHEFSKLITNDRDRRKLEIALSFWPLAAQRILQGELAEGRIDGDGLIDLVRQVKYCLRVLEVELERVDVAP